MDSDRQEEEPEHPASATIHSDPIHPVQDQDDESRVNGIEEEEDLPPDYSADLPNSDPDSISHSNSSIDEQHQPSSSSSSNATSTSTNPSSSTSTQQPPRLFFDIAPLPDATSFQAGYLGLEPLGFKAWIKGEVMLKLDGNQNADRAQESVETLQRPRVNFPWNRCSITLTAVESVTRAGESRTVELFRSTSTLWEAPSTSTSTSSTSTPPSTMPFSFQLTTDLPHCIHLPHSRLEYRLEARLHSSAGRSDQDESTSTICHLTRYTKPGSLSQLMDEDSLNSNSLASTSQSIEASRTDSSSSAASSSNLLPSTLSSQNSIPKEAFSLSPHTWSLSSPTPIHLQLGKTIYRRAEPMDLIVRIPPPETRALAEKGLRLRCVEAELVRIIEVRDGIGSSHQNGAKRKSSRAGKKPHWLNEKSDKGKQILPSGGEDADMEEIRRAIENLDSVGISRPTSAYSFSYDSTVPDYEHGEGPSNSSRDDEPPPPSIGQSSSSSSLSSSAIQTPTSSSSTSSSNQDPFLSHEALLSHSGKLCRFNSQRAILLRLTLHPPFAKANMPHPHPDHDTSSVAGPVYARAGGGGCESISQETLMHKVSFKVKVRIGMTGERGETRDVRLEREVWILPGAAGVLEDPHQGEVVSEEMNGQDEGTESTSDGLDPSRAEPNPSSDSSIEAPRISSGRRDEKRQAVHSEVEFSSNNGSFSSSSNGAGTSNGSEPPRGWQDGEEYDGFIDIGRALDAEEGDGSASGSDEWDGAYTYEDAQRDEAREFSRNLGEVNGSSTSSALGGIEHLSYSSFDSRLPLPPSSRSGLLPGIREFESSSQNQNRGYDYDARGPPPSMLESQNDWQVGVDLEVQVEGVGSAMPRRRGAEGFGLDPNLPNHPTVRSQGDFDDPPPSLWDTTDEDEATREIIRNHEDDQLNPPPPISPSGFEFEDQALHQQNGSAILSDEEGHHHHQQQVEDLPPPHSPPRPAYSLESQSSTHRDQQDSGNPPPVNSSHVLEPPPYIDSSLQNRAPQSIQNPPNLSTSADSEDRDQPPSNSILSPRSIMGISQIRSSRSDEARPPAYAHPSELNTNPQVALRRNEHVITAGGNSGGPPGYEA